MFVYSFVTEEIWFKVKVNICQEEFFFDDDIIVSNVVASNDDDVDAETQTDQKLSWGRDLTFNNNVTFDKKLRRPLKLCFLALFCGRKQQIKLFFNLEHKKKLCNFFSQTFFTAAAAATFTGKLLEHKSRLFQMKQSLA